MNRLLKGILSAITLGVVGVVVPIILVAIGANPFPVTAPSLADLTGALTSPDDGTLIMGILAVAAWLAWAVLTATILIELPAAIQGIGARRIRGLVFAQSLVRPLVIAAVALIVTAPVAAATATASSSAPESAPTISTSQIAAPAAEVTAAPERVEEVEPAGPAGLEYTTKVGDSFWAIAQEHLGSGYEYKKIAAANPDSVDASGFLHPGTKIIIPGAETATLESGEQNITVESGDTLSAIALEHLGEANDWPTIFDASKDLAQPVGGRIADPDLIFPGQTVHIPDDINVHPDVANPDLTLRPDTSPAPSEIAPDAEPAPPAAAEPAPPAAEEADSAQPGADQLVDDDEAWPVRTTGGVGAILAAGVIGVVAVRRRTQQRDRKPGQTIAMPAGEPANTEAELRAIADPISVENVDLALRTLSKKCAETGNPLPSVRAARLTAGQFDLFLAEPTELPAPWTVTADPTVWTLQATDVDRIPVEELEEIPAPYPALVTVGHDADGGHIFIDLEYIGSLGIAGTTVEVREVLAALAIELATSSWADDLVVTMVGSYAELEDALQSGRIRYVPTITRVLDELTARAADDYAALTDAGVEDLHHARTTGAVPVAWIPEIVIITTPLDESQQAQIAALVGARPRLAIAAITTDVESAEWSLDLTAGDAPDTAVLKPFGMQLNPQRIPAAVCEHMLEIVATTAAAATGDTTEVPVEPTLAQVDAAASASTETNEAVTDEPAEQGASVDAATDPAGSVPVGGDNVGDDHPVDEAGLVGGPDVSVEDEPEPAIVDGAQVHTIRLPAPRLLLLGVPELINAGGTAEPSKKARLLELAAFMHLNPGVSASSIDAAIWPGKRSEQNLRNRNSATSRLRSWLGKTVDGLDYLPRYQAGGYGLDGVESDLEDWNRLIGGDPFTAKTADLVAALQLVRCRPFSGRPEKYYAWAEPERVRLITEIADTAFALSHRCLMEGRWKAADEAAAAGLAAEPADERLWRLRVIAAHELKSPDAQREVLGRLMQMVTDLDADLEPKTEELLEQLKASDADIATLIEEAL